MPTKKNNKNNNNKKNKRGGDGSVGSVGSVGSDGKNINTSYNSFSLSSPKPTSEGFFSSLKKLTSSSPKSETGSSAKSETGSSAKSDTGKSSEPTTRTYSFFKSSVKAPVAAVTSVAASATSAVNSAASSLVKSSPIAVSSNGLSVIKYIFIFIVLAFLFLSLFLYLEKPAQTSIWNMYDPVFKIFNNPIKKQKAAVDKLEEVLVKKEIINKIDTDAKDRQKTGELKKERKYNKPPIIPKADDTTSTTQMKPKSKSGFCYIGEDRGFRSCIDVGEGDVCMSGDIFPTREICINPNLRE